MSFCIQEERELFGKFVDHCEITEVNNKHIKNAISVFVFLAGKIMEDVNR